MSLSSEMTRLNSALDQILELIPRASTIALIDEPIHRNIGDHLIQSGSEAFFRRHAINIIFRANTINYSSRRARAVIPPEAIIVCQGGGHFGDLYPHHQSLREQVIRDFPSQRIVILPQSLYFCDPVAERQALAAFRAHKRLHLCLRDQISFDRASAWDCCDVHLSPDMSHALWPVALPRPEREQQANTLYLIRQDQENLTVPDRILSHRDNFVDWKQIVGFKDTALLAMIAAGFAGERYGPAFLPLRQLLSWQSDHLVTRAVSLMAGYRQVASSRLHGALLALLLGKRVEMLDSLTGKSRAYHATWLAAIEECRMVDR